MAFYFLVLKKKWKVRLILYLMIHALMCLHLYINSDCGSIAEGKEHASHVKTSSLRILADGGYNQCSLCVFFLKGTLIRKQHV